MIGEVDEVNNHVDVVDWKVCRGQVDGVGRN